MQKFSMQVKKVLVLLVLDGATNLLWTRPHRYLKAEETLEGFREWMEHHSCVPKALVADMAFMGPVYQTFYRLHNIRTIPTGPRTPWPNRAETAVRLFKRTFGILSSAVGEDPTLRKVTFRQLVRRCVWARNNQLTLSGRTPLELSYGRRPPGLLDVETMNPEQLSIEPLEDDRLDVELKRLALKPHLEARQLNDMRSDLARNVRPSDGPYKPGDRVFYWNQDKSKIKNKGEWIRGKVLAQNGPMVTLETMNTVMTVNQSKVRREHDEWHDAPLPPILENPDISPSASSSEKKEEERPSESKQIAVPPQSVESLVFWQDVRPEFMEIGHFTPTMSFACAVRGITVATPLDLNQNPDIRTQQGQKIIADLVGGRDPYILFMFPAMAITPGWTEETANVQVQSLARLASRRMAQGKYFALLLPWTSSSWWSQPIHDLQGSSTVRLQTSTSKEGHKWCLMHNFQQVRLAPVLSRSQVTGRFALPNGMVNPDFVAAFAQGLCDQLQSVSPQLF